ncbi:ThuA domain-containing protein [Marinihelvus fidelis]|uniref:ThuA domain-containing protein n=1 Tax=Marinihelvus fidelis TaxID=2613842 RepID=A0A5N0TGI8_9GAMM|nr:ThuA domain-containing protein [Marinihelvus fidelis]KAA9134172.1 ThuA domain-containing protein [Marinihelvus fidelis]
MPRLIRFALIATFALALPLTTLAGDGPSKAVFVYGGWDGHAPKRFRDLVVPWLESEGFEVTVSDSLDIYADASVMAEVDLVVHLWTQGEITKEQFEPLRNAVQERGVGLAGWHGGLGDSFHRNQEFEYMVGGQWVRHPGNDGVRFTVNIIDHDDPITAGLDDFEVETEQYYMHVDPNNHVLATTSFVTDFEPWVKGTTMPISWTRMHGNGRVFYTALGHQPEVFDVPEAFTMLKRGILWASRSKYEDTPDLVSPVYPVE